MKYIILQCLGIAIAYGGVGLSLVNPTTFTWKDILGCVIFIVGVRLYAYTIYQPIIKEKFENKWRKI